MIDPNELMLGNYIKFNGKETIVTINTFQVLANSCKRKLFEPIEINENELIEFGFYYSKYFNSYNLKGIGFIKAKEKWFIMMDERHIFGNGFKYIHQLQNNYYLSTNEKLTK